MLFIFLPCSQNIRTGFGKEACAYIFQVYILSFVPWFLHEWVLFQCSLCCYLYMRKLYPQHKKVSMTTFNGTLYLLAGWALLSKLLFIAQYTVVIIFLRDKRFGSYWLPATFTSKAGFMPTVSFVFHFTKSCHKNNISRNKLCFWLQNSKRTLICVRHNRWTRGAHIFI